MKYRRLGSTGLEVSAITVGCMSWGDPARSGHPWVLSEDDARPIVRAAYEAGVNLFDTANLQRRGGAVSSGPIAGGSRG